MREGVTNIELAQLKRPFRAEDIEWRIARAGKGKQGVWAKVLAYITARAIMDRLDEVCGPANWRVSYTQFGSDKLTAGVLCRLEIRVGGEWVAKEDGAEQTDIEAFKGGISGALKRAGVLWGIGRYLYDLPEGFAEIVEKGTPGAYWQNAPKDKSYDAFYWLPPKLPKEFLPGKPQAPASSSGAAAPPTQPPKTAPSSRPSPAPSAPSPAKGSSSTPAAEDVPADWPADGGRPPSEAAAKDKAAEEQRRKGLHAEVLKVYRDFMTLFPKVDFVQDVLRERYEMDSMKTMSADQMANLLWYLNNEVAKARGEKLGEIMGDEPPSEMAQEPDVLGAAPDEDEVPDSQEPEDEPAPPPAPAKVAKPKAGKPVPATAADLKAVMAAAKKAGWTPEQVGKYVKMVWGKKKPTDLFKAEAELLVGVVRSAKFATAAAEVEADRRGK